MSQTELTQSSSQLGKFHRTNVETATCDCPIHRQEGEIFTAPLGLQFRDHVTVDTISHQKASQIYDCHHSYMSGEEMHKSNIAHHGIYFQDKLVGAITYRPPLGRRRLDWDNNDNLVPRPKSELKLDSLHSPLKERAKQFIDPPHESEIEDSHVFGGTEIIEINRICIGVNMPNLASCALSKSQKAFLSGPNCPEDTQYLLTLVRADFDASMIKALSDLGWTLRGLSEPTTPTNREHKSINDRYKWVWVCPATVATNQQATLEKWKKS